MSERKRVVRTIVIDGDSDWVDKTLEKSIVPEEGSRWEPHSRLGYIKCISCGVESVELIEKNQEKNNA